MEKLLSILKDSEKAFFKNQTLKKNLCKQGIELCRPNKDILQLTAHLKLGNGKLPMELRNTARAPLSVSDHFFSTLHTKSPSTK